MSTLILGVHNHQPVGNFDHVFKDAHERAYRPFLELLARHPGVKMAVHSSGPLLEWQKREAPDYVERLRELALRGQVELFGGAYWEPILTVLPEADQHAQLERMSAELESLFGVRPRGVWLAERIWEPSLPRILAAHGLDYVALDDSHFLATGFKPEQLRGYFLSEEGGNPIAVFPISMRLRYLVPFHPVEKILAELRAGDAAAGGDLSVLMDDGEKFGVWSSTNTLCYEEGYLERLFGALEAAPDIRMSSFAECRDETAPLGWAYLPTASYFEMGEWALPREGQSQMKALTALVKKTQPELIAYVRGGFWRNFFVKYEESHWMHKRMLSLGRRLDRARDAGADPVLLARAEDLKLQAQCNCAYWHGLFGGLYLPHLRQAIFERIVSAEALLHDGGYDLEREDLDLDGADEIIWTGPKARLWIKAESGGRVREIDFLARPFPLSNVLTRRRELYHDQIKELDDESDAAKGAQSIHEVLRVKEPGLDRYLDYDPHARAGLEERLYVRDAEKLSYGDAWFDFSDLSFRAELPARADGSLVLSADCEFELGRRLSLDKRLSWTDEGAALAVELELGYEGPGRLAACFASGWNFNLLAPDAPDRRVMIDGAPAGDPRLRSEGWARGIGRLELVDEWSGVAVALAGEGLDVYREPIETVSLSEAGFERVYQGSWLAIARHIDLSSGQSLRFAYRVELRALERNSS